MTVSINPVSINFGDIEKTASSWQEVGCIKKLIFKHEVLLFLNPSILNSDFNDP